MSTSGTRQAAPNTAQKYRAVALFTAIELIAALGIQSYLVITARGIQSYLVSLLPVIFPTIVICMCVGLIGALIVFLEETRARGGGPPSGAGPTLLFFIIIAVIFGAFYYSHGHKSSDLALYAGVASALTWGLSVVGGLIWSNLLFSSIYWNSWFNLFAAVFAALAVGYTK
jgi:uncharacterized membrane protein